MHGFRMTAEQTLGAYLRDGVLLSAPSAVASIPVHPTGTPRPAAGTAGRITVHRGATRQPGETGGV